MSTDAPPSIQGACKNLLAEVLDVKKIDRAKGTHVHLNAHGTLTMNTRSLKTSEYALGLFEKAGIDVADSGVNRVGRLFRRAGGCCGSLNRIELSVRLNKAQATKLAAVLREELGDDHQPSSPQVKAALACARPFDMAWLRAVPRAPV